LKDIIKKVMGGNINLIDSAKQVAIEVKKILSEEGLLENRKRGKPSFFVSDNPDWFEELAGRFLGKPVKNVKKVNNV